MSLEHQTGATAAYSTTMKTMSIAAVPLLQLNREQQQQLLKEKEMLMTQRKTRPLVLL